MNNSNKPILRKLLQKQALGYDPDTIPKEVYEAIKTQKMVRQVLNPTYAVSLSIAIRTLLFGIFMKFIGETVSLTVLSDIGNYSLSTSVFFFVGWLILRSVK